MTNLLSQKTSISRWFKKPGWVIVLIIIFLMILAIVSYDRTGVIWNGSYPPAEFNLTIQNISGQPIEGATINIFRRGTRTPTFEYPIDNYLEMNSLVSDNQGLILIIHKPRGVEFGGFDWKLFWMIPISSGTPDFDYEISAIGYKPIRSSITQIFRVTYSYDGNATNKTIQVYGREIEIRIFEQKITLKKQ
jgi:hypothetical protein